MDDHTYLLLQRLENDIRRAHLVIEQLCLHVTELPPNRSSDARRWLSRARGDLDRHYRIRAALLETDRGAWLQ